MIFKTKFKNLLTILLIAFLFFHAAGQSKLNKRMLIRIELEQKSDIKLLDDMFLDFATHRINDHAEVIVTESELKEIHNRGFNTSIISSGSNKIDVQYNYRSSEEYYELWDSYIERFPSITKQVTIGYSQLLGKKIQAIKISDNPEIEEDEPAIMYNGMHHAREPVGTECCIKIIEYLLNNYGLNGEVTKWVDNYEIWIVPMINPEGWYYMYENNFESPWWRKNLRDNNDNGVIDRDQDGVDLNRNYHHTWNLGGSDEPSSWTYRGRSPFSETETKANRNLSQAQKFVCSISYHSYGEIVIYPWSGGHPAQDQALINEMVQNVAGRIPKYSREGYYDPSVTGYNGGMSMNWQYAKNGTIEFIVETSDEFMPTGSKARSVANDNLSSALYLLERLEGPGVTGTVTDSETGEPIPALVKVVEHYDPELYPRKCDGYYGRFYRLLLPGTYTLEISKEGYKTQTIENVIVGEEEMTQLGIMLEPGITGIKDISMSNIGNVSLFSSYPNPFSDNTKIEYKLKNSCKVILRILDMSGREIYTLENSVQPPGKYSCNWDGRDNNGNNMPPGFYIYSIETKYGVLSKRMLKL